MVRKKILIIQESFGGGGAEKVLTDILQYFDFDKYDLSLLLLNAYGPHITSIPANVKIYRCNKNKPTLFWRIINRWIIIRDFLLKHKVRSLLNGKNFYAIISFLEGPATKAHSFVMDKAKNNITWVHTNLVTNHWSRFAFRSFSEEKSVYEKMDEIVFVSKGCKNAFIDKFHIHDNLHVIYNVIDHDIICSRAEEKEVTKNRFTICNVGRLTPQKRQDRLIEVAHELKRRNLDFEVWIIGTGKLEKSLRDLSSRLNVDDRIKFLGFKSNPYPYMKASDIFLLTSDTEGYPTVVCEALCLGIPIVSTDITGTDELLANDVGILTTFNINEIADKVELLITNNELRQHYAAKALEKGNTFTPENSLQQIYALL